tara:strand:- start:1254 stop:2336 length:1083 start_codon:yes stop_codon:yes gene_type:complete
METLLIVGGGGFIGTHTCLHLLEANYNLIVVDNFSNSSPIGLKKVIEISNLKNDIETRLKIKVGDVRNLNFLDKIFSETAKSKMPIKGVIHFAGVKSISESIYNPLLYWDINVAGSNNLLKVMHKYDCKTFVFSSSATIYGNPSKIPIKETANINPLNPYGNTKAAVEKLLADIAGCQNSRLISQYSPNGWRIAILRYFNPVGAHLSGKIGESPSDNPSNLFPFISQVAVGKQSLLKIFGNDWGTKDGTGVRDYIHVMDLAEGHTSALKYLLKSKPQLITLNLGTGKGTSVLEVVRAFEKITKKVIPFTIVEKRQGDSAIAVADVQMAKKLINWESKFSLLDMCRSAWKWQKLNPEGYKS